MKHIILIDSIEQLVIKKDSSLLLALTLKEMGHSVSLLFEKDLIFKNKGDLTFKLTDFEGMISNKTQYIESFKLLNTKRYKLKADDIIHMRLDPPFDCRYLRVLWILKSISEMNHVKIFNSAEGILVNNEKLHGYIQKESLPSFVGESKEEFEEFTNELKAKGYDEVVLKPLDLFQGIGVEKFLISDTLSDKFIAQVKKYDGPVIAQPFYKDVTHGETRTIYFAGSEIGTILKVPKKGDFLANIASGATYKLDSLTGNQKNICDKISKDLLKEKIYLIAFDLMGDMVSEVNITCPGLLVETSSAYGRNLSVDIINMI